MKVVIVMELGVSIRGTNNWLQKMGKRIIIKRVISFIGM